jgi:nucleoside-diphosphate-sugar epimerase
VSRSQSKVLIVGATGVVGQAAMHHFAALPGWDVVGLSRRQPQRPDGVEWIGVDLASPVQCQAAVKSLAGVTHLIYAALYEIRGLSAGWFSEEVINRNQAMLQNLVDPLLSAAEVRHISLMQGTKAYGMHYPSIGWKGVKIPLREREPRTPHPNFYFVQEDYLRQKQEGMDWGLTVFRPTVVYGDAVGNNMNPIPVLGAWAALLRDGGPRIGFSGPSAVRDGFRGRRC